MKLTIVVETILLCIIITLFCIFTIDAVAVRKAEMTSIISTEVNAITEEYFDGDLTTENIILEIETAVRAVSSSQYSQINTTILHANQEKGLLNIQIEVIYTQPNGRPRSLVYNRIFIREKQWDPEAEDQYEFVRNIDVAHYKEGNTFVDEANGGLKSDSIWRTEEYEDLLDSVFAIN